MLRDARILILDEPVTGLDGRTQRHVWAELQQLMEGRTTILITHEPTLAADMGRVYHLRNGRLVAEAETAESFRPKRAPKEASRPALGEVANLIEADQVERL